MTPPAPPAPSPPPPPAAFSHAAAEDLRAAVSWIADHNPAAAEALRAAVRDAASRIGTWPGCGVLRPAVAPPPFRFLPLPGLPYVVIYEPGPPPRILRVLHGARDLPDRLRD